MYTRFYELKEEPFRLTPDPRFLHLADPHRAALKLLLQGVIQRKGFLVVTGPVGTGKTTLLHTALQILSEKSGPGNRVVSAFLVNPTLSPSELLEAMLDEFEISCSSPTKPARLAAFHQMLYQTQQQGGTSLLLIDEAHLMSVELLEEIRLLGNTDTYQEKLIQIVLSGQPELFRVLHRPELRALQQRIAGTCQLRPLSLPETRAYIAERLHAAGLRGAVPFTTTAMESVHNLSGGVPRLINLLCDSSLSIGFEIEKRQIDQAIVKQAAEDLPSLSAPPAAVHTSSVHNGDHCEALPSATGAFWKPGSTMHAIPTESSGPTPPAAANGVVTNGGTPAVVIISPGGGDWTKSTFDTLISVLRQGRANVRE
jgi:general secretion pathway protein A